MVNVDPSRAALVTQQYRYAINKDASIKALNNQAISIEIDTNLDAASATTLSNTLFNVLKANARTFQVTIEDVLYLEDFTVSPNRYVCNFAKHPAAATNIIYTVIGAEIDYSAGITTLTVRG